jgi:hypothetical protein
MSDENIAPAKSQENTDNQKIQKLVIYLPEGSVILDRTNMEHGELPDEILDYTKSASSATVVQPIQIPISEQPRIGGNKEVPQFDIPVPAQPGLAAIGREHGRHRRGHYPSNWMHVTNITFVTIITAAALIPGALATFFGIAIYAANTNLSNAAIERGDLMISKVLPVFELKANDVLLLHDNYAWNLQVRQVVTSTMAADSTTLVTTDGGNASGTSTATIQSATLIHKVTSIVPQLGYWVMVLTSTIMKISIGIVLIALNVFFYRRKVRRRRWVLT